jgi:thiamine transport system substrate-binding protein
MNFRLIISISVLTVLLVSCGPSTPRQPGTLTVMTHDSFSISEEVVAAFEGANNAKVIFLESGDTGTALNKAILSKDNPLADVFYGVDNTFVSRALREDIFEIYEAPLLEKIPAEFKLDQQSRAIPVDYGDVCFNFDKAYFEAKNLAPPGSLDDLTKPEYESLVVVENPATSSPGLAFLLATVAYYGEENYLDYWRKLVENDLLVVNDWNSAYYTEFSRSGGARPIVLSYASSPVAEVLFASEPLEQAPTAAIIADGSCFRQIEFVGILKGTPNRELAEKWVDFMLSTTFQEDMPLQMFVYPVNPDAQIDEVFSQFSTVPENPATLDPQTISDNRERYIQEWTAVVLR